MSPESVKNIECVGQMISKIEQKIKSPYGLIKTAHETQFGRFFILEIQQLELWQSTTRFYRTNRKTAARAPVLNANSIRLCKTPLSSQNM